MEEIVFKEISRDSELYDQALQLRYDLFFRDLNLPWDILFDEYEESCGHFVVLHEYELVAYVRLMIHNDTALFSQMVVKPQFQKMGFGSLILQEMKKVTLKRGAKEIRLSARMTAVDFYSKCGYSTVGSVYNSKKTQLKHIEMVNKL